MKKTLVLILVFIPLSTFADTVIFTKTFGGSENDYVYSIQQTADGGYIVAGQTESFGNGSYRNPDMWVIKLDKTGNTEWEKTFGGIEGDLAYSIQQTTDLGYVVAGTTSSYGKGYPAIWIIKLDTKGDSIWNKIYEGTIVSSAHSISQTADGGYIVAGKGKENILKLNKDGNKEWGKHYSWIFYSVEQTTDGGYIAVGDSIYQQEEWDYIPSLTIIKLDRAGCKEWCNPLGNDFTGRANSVKQTADGGYIVAGDSIYMMSKYEHSHFSLVIKLDGNGKKVWKYSGSKNSAAQSVQQIAGGEYIIAGNATDNEFGLDLLVVQLDKNGKEKWIKTYGKNLTWEYASSIRQTTDGGYVVAGQTESFGAGRYDMWILKLDENGNGPGPVGISDPKYNDFNGFSLQQNYPNPFNQSTSITFDLSEPSDVTLSVYDISGVEIETIFSGQRPPGVSNVEWTPKNLLSGIYFYRLKVGQFSKTKSFVLQKKK